MVVVNYRTFSSPTVCCVDVPTITDLFTNIRTHFTLDGASTVSLVHNGRVYHEPSPPSSSSLHTDSSVTSAASSSSIDGTARLSAHHLFDLINSTSAPLTILVYYEMSESLRAQRDGERTRERAMKKQSTRSVSTTPTHHDDSSSNPSNDAETDPDQPYHDAAHLIARSEHAWAVLRTAHDSIPPVFFDMFRTNDVMLVPLLKQVHEQDPNLFDHCIAIARDSSSTVAHTDGDGGAPHESLPPLTREQQTDIDMIMDMNFNLDAHTIEQLYRTHDHQLFNTICALFESTDIRTTPVTDGVFDDAPDDTQPSDSDAVINADEIEEHIPRSLSSDNSRTDVEDVDDDVSDNDPVTVVTDGTGSEPLVSHDEPSDPPTNASMLLVMDDALNPINRYPGQITFRQLY